MFNAGNYLQGLSGGLAVGQQMQGMTRQNALADIYSEHGQGIMQGDMNALGALAQVDPQAAFDMRRAGQADARAQQSHRMDMQIDELRVQQIKAQAAQVARQEAQAMDAARLTAERQETMGAATALRGALMQGPDAFEAVKRQYARQLQENNIDPNSLTFEMAPYVLSALVGTLEGLDAGNDYYDAIGGGEQNEPASMQALRLRAQEAGMQPGTPEYQDFMRSGGHRPDTTVNVNQGSPYPGLSKLGEGMTYLYDEQGQILRDEMGRPMSAPVAGSDRDLDRQNTQRAAEQAEANKGQAADIVLQDIRAVKGMLTGGRAQPVTGVAGRMASMLPGSEASDARALAETIKANIGFDRLQQMREASPTGGALGQVTERELATLQAVLGNLEFSQSKDQLLRNLTRLETVYSDILDKIRATGDGTYLPRSNGTGPQLPNVPDFSQMSDEELDAYIRKMEAQ